MSVFLTQVPFRFIHVFNFYAIAVILLYQYQNVLHSSQFEKDIVPSCLQMIIVKLQ